MKVNLVAVQAKPVTADYASGDAFYRKMAALMKRAMRDVDRSIPTLVAYPEGIGLPLAFVPQTYEQIGDAKTIVQVFLRAVPKNLPRFSKAWLKFRTSFFRTVFLETALEAEEIYVTAFSSLAREYGVYVSAGCVYLPHIEEEAVKGRHTVGKKVYNQSYLFNPGGVCLRRTPKINLAPPTEPRFGFSPGNRADLMRSIRRSAAWGRSCATTRSTAASSSGWTRWVWRSSSIRRTTSAGGMRRPGSTSRSPSARRGSATDCRR